MPSKYHNIKRRFKAAWNGFKLEPCVRKTTVYGSLKFDDIQEGGLLDELHLIGPVMKPYPLLRGWYLVKEEPRPLITFGRGKYDIASLINIDLEESPE